MMNVQGFIKTSNGGTRNRQQGSHQKESGDKRGVTLLRLSGPMRLEEGMNLAHRQRDSFLGFLPREHAHFGLWREHRTLHGDGVRVRGDLVRKNQDWVLATTHEIARHG